VTSQSETGAEHSSDDPVLTREALCHLVWTEPLLQVAARLGVSSSYVARTRQTS
jgi:hypothetical protein